MNIIDMRSVYREKLDLSIDECDFIYKIILKELCDIDPIKIALDPNFNLSSESEKTLLPLISYENQNILLERSKLENIKEYLENNNTLTKSDLKFLEKISKKYRIKTNDKHQFDKRCMFYCND